MAKSQKSYTPEFKQHTIMPALNIGYITPQQKEDEELKKAA